MMFVRSAGLFGLAGVCAVAPALVAKAQTAKGVGSVVAEDGKPVSSATVVLYEYDGAKPIYNTLAVDAQGNFSIPSSDNPRILSVRQKYGVHLFVTAPGYAIAAKSFKPGETVRFTLTSETVLHGTVINDAGKPVANAPVRLSDVWIGAMDENNRVGVPEQLAEKFTVKTNAAGEWELRGVPAGASKVWVTLDDPRFVYRTTTLTIKGAATKFAITAVPGATLTGTVVDAAGKPASGILVYANKTSRVGVQDFFDREKTVTTDTDGTFRLPQLGNGTFSVEVAAKERDLVAPATPALSVPAGQTVALAAPIRLTTGGVVTGSVVGKDTKKPVAGVIVYANNWLNQVQTSADGTFRLRVAPGDSVVHIGSNAEGYTYYDPQQAVAVREGETKAISAFELPPTFTVTLQVADESGKPVPDLPLRIYHPGWQDGRRVQDYARTDASGVWNSKNDERAELSGDSKEQWEIRIAPEYEVVSPQTLALPSDKPIAVVVRKLNMAGRPHGRIVTPDGKPVLGINVSVSSWFDDGDNGQRDWKSEYNVAADDNGKFALTPLRPNAQYRLSISKPGYRVAKPLTKATLPADGKQPDLGDIVMIPLDGSISGVVVGATGKPVMGAWIWSPDGDPQVSARTDTKGVFTLDSVPKTGETTLQFARGSATATYNLTKRTGNRLNLATVSKPATPLATIAAQNKKRAFALINEIAAESPVSEGVRARNAGADKLATLIAEFDLDAALKIGADKEGKVSEGVLSEIMDKALAHSPDRVRALYETNVPKWSSPWRTLWRSADLAVVYAGKDPAFAMRCYETARKQIGEGIPADRLWETMMVARLAYYLRTPDADEWGKRVLDMTIKERGGNVVQGTAGAAEALAAGDGVRAAKLLNTLPKDKRGDAAIGILTGMMTGSVTYADGDYTAQPMQARRLWEGWIADGTIKATDEHWRYTTSSQAAVSLVKALAKTQPDAAYSLAKQAPQMSRWRALLWAATGQTDPKLRVQRYREAVNEQGNGWGNTGHYVEALRLATLTGDTAFAAEMRTALVKSIASGQEAFSGNATDNAARVTFVLGTTTPEMCRYYLEASLQQTREHNPDNDNAWLATSTLQGMTLIDLPRALEIARGMKDAKSQTDCKLEIIRTLLTPPSRWNTLLNEQNFY